MVREEEKPIAVTAAPSSWPAIIAQAAQAAAGAQHWPAGTLYVVATPIGNRADLTLRAVHALGRVDAVACEDTRVSGALLAHLGLAKPLIALHEHNEHQAAALVIERLARGERVAYLSDAGTPAVSDPGAALVAAVRAAGHACVPIPGASRRVPSRRTLTSVPSGNTVSRWASTASIGPPPVPRRTPITFPS